MKLPPPYPEYVTHSMQNSPAKRAHLDAYGLACAEAMREACAKACDEAEAIAKPQCEANYTDGDSWIAGCAAAIRSIEVER